MNDPQANMEFEKVTLSKSNAKKPKLSNSELMGNLKSVFFLSAVSIALFVWILDPFIDAVLLHEGTFYQQLTHPTASEKYSRSLFSMLIIVFGFVGSFLLSKSRQAEKTLRNSEESLRKSEARLKEAQRLAQIGNWELDLQSNTLHWSDEVYKILGIEPGHFGTNNEAFLNCIHPDDWALVDNSYRDSVKNRTPFNIVHRLRKKDGSIKFVNARCETLYDHAGKAVRSIGTIQDVTERKQAEEVLRESEERYRAIFEQAVDSISLIDAETAEILEFNDAAHKNLGYTRGEFQRLTISDIEAAESHHEVLYHVNRLAEKGTGFLETRHRTKSGDLRDVLVSARIVALQKRKALLSVWHDITGPKLAEEALRESEHRYRVLFEEAPVPLWEQDFSQVKRNIDLLKQEGVKDFRGYFDQNPEKVTEYAGVVIILEVNKAVLELHEATAKEDLQEGLSLLFTEQSIGSFKEELVAIAEERTDCEFETTVKTLRGKEKFVYLKWSAVPGYEETMERVYVSTIDITNRKRAEGELKKLSTAITQSPVSVVITDPQGNIQYVNPKFCRLTGYSAEDVLGKNPRILRNGEAAKEVYEQLWETILAGKTWRGEFHNKKKNGEPYWEDAVISAILDDSGVITHFLAVKEDITERKHAEEERAILESQLHRSQRLETIGTLTGGIAHDFNNILTPIMGYAEMARHRVPSSNPISAMLERIFEGTHRAKELVEQILLFSQHTEKQRKPVNLQLIVQEAVKLLRPSIPATIEIRQRIDVSCGRVSADASQIHQVIVNLCTNAWQAMEEKGGALTIELKHVEVDAATARLHPNLNEAEYVRLSVIDTGIGMTDLTLDRVFEPFFTTKAVDKGTGMGLSVAHGIARGHGGDILVSSEQGKGSTFHVYLPIVRVEKAATDEERQAIEGGQESLLVVDDDKAIVEMMRVVLGQLGYKVEVHTCSREALKAFRLQPNQYDLVISDLTMPHMTGSDLSRQIQDIRTGIPIIIITGYGDKLADDTQKLCGINKVIGKPVVTRELASAIREILDK